MLDNNKAWRSAETVRRAWLAEFVTRKTAPKGAEALICAAAVEGPHWLRQAFERSHPLLRTLRFGEEQAQQFGHAAEVETLATDPSTPKALSMRTLAAILTAWEASTDVHTWRNPDEWGRRCMEALTGLGIPGQRGRATADR